MWLALTVFGIGFAAACAMFGLVLVNVWPLIQLGGNSAPFGWSMAWPLMLTWPAKGLFGHLAQQAQSRITAALSLAAVVVISCIEAFVFHTYAPAWLPSGAWYVLVSFSTAGVCIGVHLLATVPETATPTADPFLGKLRQLGATNDVPGVVAHSDGAGFTASQAALAGALGVAASTVNVRLKELQAQGLIEKRSDYQGTTIRFVTPKVVQMAVHRR